MCVFTANSFSAHAFLVTEHKQQRASDLDASHTQRHEDAGITDHVGRGTPSGAYGCRPADHHLKVFASALGIDRMMAARVWHVSMVWSVATKAVLASLSQDYVVPCVPQGLAQQAAAPHFFS